MATRKTSKKKRTTTRRRKPATRSRKTTSKRTSSKRRTPPSRAKTPPKTVATGLSLDRKLDILGVGLALIGFLTFLSLLSTNHSSLIGAWMDFLRQALGWGLWLLPLGLVGLGLWLILRHFERIPQVSVERILGIVLLYVGLLTLFELGHRGGQAGAITLNLLQSALGGLGAGTALFAWLLIALAMSLDVPIAALFRWAPPLGKQVLDWGQTRLKQLRATNIFTNPPTPSPPLVTSQPISEVVAISPPMHPQPSMETEDRAWVLPPVDQILDSGGEVQFDDEFDRQRARLIEETLASFGAPARVVEINRGPTITQYEVEPDFVESRSGRTRVRVGKIASLADDLALALAASRIRVQAPVPGKGYVGIEVPNEEIALVALRDAIESEAFRRLKSPIRFALGQNVAGHAVAADLAAMPHLLIAGATGSGKSVCVNALISCLLLHNTPNELRLLMVDPKRVELTGYNGIPHLLAPVVVDLERVVGALQWVSREMDQRYHRMAKAGARHIHEYNANLEERGEPTVPYLVVIIDELADLMMLAPDETERTITRLAQLARATGIHLVISTQRPSVNVVTGLIKANFPARIAFAVASGIDSRVILDQPGAERLLGSGDMLFQAPDAAAPIRLQGVFVSDNEIFSLVQYWRSLTGSLPETSTSPGQAVDAPPPGIPLKQMPMFETLEKKEKVDPLLDEAIDIIRRQGRASISMLQRRLRIGYTRAARLVESMEEKGIVSSPLPGTHTREILDYGPAAPPVDER